MKEITGEHVKSAIAGAIALEISKEEYKKIYKEKQSEGLMFPCFFILELSVTQNKEVHYIREHHMSVRYHPNINEQNFYETCARMGNKLLKCLHFIDDNDGGLRGKNLSYEVVDNVLHFSVTYRLRVKEQVLVKQKQENIEINERVKR